MRKITELNAELKNFEGTPIALINEIGKPEVLTVKRVFLNHLGAYKAKTGEEAIRAVTLGQNIYKSNGEVQIEDSDFDLLKKALKEMQYTSVVMGQIFKLLENI